MHSIVSMSWRCLPLLAISWALGGCEQRDASRGDTGQAFHRFWPDNLYGVDFVDRNLGFISGYSGTVLRTIDGGKSWEAHYIGRNELIRRVSFADREQGWAVGHRGSIFHSANGGKSWQVQKEVPNVFLRDVSFADRNNGWIVGHDSLILHTGDGGASWSVQKLEGFQGRDLPRLHGVYAQDAQHAVLVGEFGVIAYTEDAGAAWTILPNESRGTLLAVTASGERYLAVGLDGEVKAILPAVPSAAGTPGERADKVVAAKSAPLAAPYRVATIESGTDSHFFSVTATADGRAVAAGRAVVASIVGDTVMPLRGTDAEALPFTWFGGAAVLPDGRFWLAGIRGLVARGELTAGSFETAFSLGATDRVRQVSSRWTIK